MAKATQPSVILTDFLPKRLIVKIMPNDNSHTLIPKEKKMFICTEIYKQKTR